MANNQYDSSWPTYEVGPKESMLALGVVSANYARLEFALTHMYAVIIGIDSSEATMRISRIIRKNTHLERMRRHLENRPQWPSSVRDLCARFIDGFSLLNDNRNKLMHSNVISSSAEITVLYKTNREGKTELCAVSLAELRQVADDIKAYFDYGLHLGNMISHNLLGLPYLTGSLIFHQWPDQPPLPVRLEYSSEPIALRR